MLSHMVVKHGAFTNANGISLRVVLSHMVVKRITRRPGQLNGLRVVLSHMVVKLDYILKAISKV